MLPVIRTKSAGSPPPAEVLDKGFPSLLLYPLGQLVIWKTLGYLRAAFALLTSACPAFSQVWHLAGITERLPAHSGQVSPWGPLGGLTYSDEAVWTLVSEDTPGCTQ